MILKREKGDKTHNIQQGQWINRASASPDGICATSRQVSRTIGPRIYYIDSDGREGYMMVDSIAFVSDTKEEADKMYAISTEQIRAINAVRERFHKVVDQMTGPYKRDDMAVHLALLLTSLDDVPVEEIAKWTDEQCQQAEEWAHAVHLHASDNDEVIVPPKPECLNKYPERPFNLI